MRFIEILKNPLFEKKLQIVILISWVEIKKLSWCDLKKILGLNGKSLKVKKPGEWLPHKNIVMKLLRNVMLGQKFSLRSK